MDQNKLEKWLAAYKDLDKKYSEEFDRMIMLGKAGRRNSAAKIERKLDEITAIQEGMEKALEIFGYVAIPEDGDIVIEEA